MRIVGLLLGLLSLAELANAQTRPCCFPSTGGCIDLTPSQCAEVGGIAGPAGRACAGYVCFPVGACCLPTGECEPNVSSDDCASLGGSFLGGSSTCAACPTPTGACCFENGSCLVLTEQQCITGGFVWTAGGVSCDHPFVCGGECPADVTSDGRVALDDLAALLAVYAIGYPDVLEHLDADLQPDLSIDLADLALLLSRWGQFCDADNDGVGDPIDQCPGFDDRLDGDGDGVPDACDRCPNASDSDDDDSDGVPNGCDICAGGDDALDADGDGIPDACDACPNGDNLADTDGDETPDGCDQCPGFDDDGPDLDGDGVMNRCDLGVAVYVLADPNDPASVYHLTEGGTLWATCSLAGFGDAVFNVVGTGFSNGTPQNGSYVITTRVSLRMEGEQADVGGFNFGLQYPWDAASQTHRLNNIGMFLFVAPATVDNRMGLFRVTLTDPSDGQVRANVSMNVLVRMRGVHCN